MINNSYKLYTHRCKQYNRDNDCQDIKSELVLDLIGCPIIRYKIQKDIDNINNSNNNKVCNKGYVILSWSTILVKRDIIDKEFNKTNLLFTMILLTIDNIKRCIKNIIYRIAYFINLAVDNLK